MRQEVPETKYAPRERYFNCEVSKWPLGKLGIIDAIPVRGFAAHIVLKLNHVY